MKTDNFHSGIVHLQNLTCHSEVTGEHKDNGYIL
jgi:hypothetical protein